MEHADKEERPAEFGGSEKSLERIDLPITGMSCATCALKIEKGLAGVEGVSKATVNFASERATVVFHPAQTNVSQLIDKVKDLGYGARIEKVLLPIQGMTCASCVNKVEKALSSVKGVVRAGVNFATERASVEYIPEEVSIRDLKRVVEAAGCREGKACQGGGTLEIKKEVYCRRLVTRSHSNSYVRRPASGEMGRSLEGDEFLHPILVSDPSPILDGLAILCGFLEGDET
jgi:copper ion binding protein